MHRLGIKAGILWLALIVFMSISHPAKIPAIGLIVPYVLLYAASFYTLKAIVEHRGDARTDSTKSVKGKVPITLSTILVILVAMQSIGQLTLRDVIAVFFVVIIGYFYIHRNGLQQKK